MNIKNLFDDDSAVSPVIGVILMVAITVILAAVIGSFVLGLGSNVESTPSATFSFDYDGDFTGTAGDASITVTHDGGESIDRSALSIVSGGSTVYEDGEVGDGYTLVDNDNWPTSVTSASSIEIQEDTNSLGESDDDVSVIWTSDSGESSQTLATGTLP